MKTLKSLFEKGTDKNNIENIWEDGAMIYARHLKADRKFLHYQTALEIGLILSIAIFSFLLV